MDNFGLIIVEAVSAVLAFVLVWFMAKPYIMTRESRYLGLPVGFALLGASYVLMGVFLFLGETQMGIRAQWLQLFTAAYAFTFLGMTYHFSGKSLYRRRGVLPLLLISFLLLLITVSFIIVLLPPVLSLPSYKTADEYFRIFNMTWALYLTVHTLRSHAKEPSPKTILAPLGYALFAFSQYSFLIWSLDTSFSAFVGAHIIRFASLGVFLFVSYKSILAGNSDSTVFS